MSTPAVLIPYIIFFKKDISNERINEFAKRVETEHGRIIARYEHFHGFAADLNVKLISFFESSDAVEVMAMDGEVKPGQDVDLRSHYIVSFKASVSKEKVDQYYAEVPNGGGKQGYRLEIINGFSARLTIEQAETFRNNDGVKNISPVKPVGTN